MSASPAGAGDDVVAPLPDDRRREVVRQALSVGGATGAYGISFGALAVLWPEPRLQDGPRYRGRGIAVS